GQPRHEHKCNVLGYDACGTAMRIHRTFEAGSTSARSCGPRERTDMTNVVRPLQHHARNHPDSLVIRGDDRHWSYAELLADSLDFAVTLRRAGHAPGARIVLIAPTVPEFVIAYLGMQAAGVVTVPMNTMSTREEIEYVLGDAGATAIIAWHADNAAAIAAGQASGVEVISLEASGPHENRIRETTEVVEREPTDTAAILYTSGTT